MSEAPSARPKRPAPWRGRKRVKDPRGKFIGVRCTPEEHARIDRAAREAGLTSSGYLRAVALGSPGPRSVRRPPAEKEELSRILAELGKIGSNVNQRSCSIPRQRHARTGVAPFFLG
jgi:hypothetical protein